MTSVSDAGAASGLTHQFQAAATKTALNVQKQEGEAAVSLIESAVDVATQTVSSQSGPKSTGNLVDVQV